MATLGKALGAAAAIALLGSGAAVAQVDLFASGGVGVVRYVDIYGPSYSETMSGWQLEGAASAAFMFTPSLGAQGDVVINFDRVRWDDYPDDEYTHTSIDGALHLFYRDPSTFLLGGLVQIGSTTERRVGYDWSGTLNRLFAGLEAQLFLDSFTLYGQLGLYRVTPADDLDEAMQGTLATIEARYFLTPDFKIEAHAGYAGGVVTEWDDKLVSFNLGASAEYRFTDSPFSVFAKYDYFNHAFAGVDSARAEHRFLVGAKVNFGSDTLLDRDRNGASLKPVWAPGYGLMVK